MKVFELERELVLGQEWAVEHHKPFVNDDGELCEDIQTYHFKVGDCLSFSRWFLYDIDSIKSVSDCITLSVRDALPFE